MSKLDNLLTSLDLAKVKLVSVTKTRSESEIMLLYNKGLRCFGENRVFELIQKKDVLPNDIEWHMIGHLQTKKVKKIAPFIDMIQSLDRISLWNEIDKQAKNNQRKISCLLEIKIAQEASKHGYNWNELCDFLANDYHKTYDNINICGVMGMATYSDDQGLISHEFNTLKSYFDDLKLNFFPSTEFQWISMGMSGDYKTAISAGSNMVRIGSLLFQ